jgi:hypothetical protein
MNTNKLLGMQMPVFLYFIHAKSKIPDAGMSANPNPMPSRKGDSGARRAGKKNKTQNPLSVFRWIMVNHLLPYWVIPSHGNPPFGSSDTL